MAGTISWIPNLTTAGNITTTAGNVIGGGRVRKVEYYSNQSVNISRNSHIVFMNVTTVTGGGGRLTAYLPTYIPAAAPSATNIPLVDGQEYIIVCVAGTPSDGPVVSGTNVYVVSKTGGTYLSGSTSMAAQTSMRLVYSSQAAPGGAWIEI